MRDGDKPSVMEYTLRVTFRVSGTLVIDANSEEEALKAGEEHAIDFGVPGLDSLEEEFDEIDVESVAQ